ncbi:MAG: hypothetical protein EHM28_08515 [Spirochaetaceae bacterium]|nr:MAG: hypothetical protein EHM28_08515 [Spirochaetaceae bacterium]
MENKFTLDLSRKEIIGLFLVLKKNAQTHDTVQARLIGQIERMLYDVMTIEEMETLEAVYKNMKGK